MMVRVMKQPIFKHLMLVGAVFGLLGANFGYTQSTGGDQDAAVVVVPVYEQDGAESYTPLSENELQALVGPIALYPDDLIAIALAASAYPLQIVQAARYLDALAEDSSLEPDEDWDDAVVALLNYPQVIDLMNEDLDWTWKLGEAVVYQQGEVMDAIQAFRDRAYAAGNLETDAHQIVSYDRDVIRIAPAERNVIYVPYYEPHRVVVYQRSPVFYYYPDPCPVYYYPYPFGYSFSSHYFWGVTSAFTLGWHTHRLHVHHYYHDSHPYYGHDYYNHFYLRRHEPRHYPHHHSEGRQRGLDPTRYRDREHHEDDPPNYVQSRDGEVWQPGLRHGARPGAQRVRVRGTNVRVEDGGNSDHGNDTRVTQERDPRPAVRVRSYPNHDDSTQTARDTNRSVPNDSRTVRDTSRNVPDDSWTVRDTSRTVPDDSRTARDTSRTASDTSRTTRGTSGTTHTTESVRHTRADTDSDAREHGRTVRRAINPSNDTFSFGHNERGERVTRQETPPQLSRAIRDSKQHAETERRRTSTISTSRPRNRTDTRDTRAESRRMSEDVRTQAAPTRSSTESKQSNQQSRSDKESSSRSRDDEKSSSRKKSRRYR